MRFDYVEDTDLHKVVALVREMQLEIARHRLWGSVAGGQFGDEHVGLADALQLQADLRLCGQV